MTEHLYLKKIIATTDTSLGYTDHRISPVPNFCSYPSPSESFIKAFIEAYNNGNIIEDVLVEIEKANYDKWFENGGSPVFDTLKLKDNNIIIKKMKDSWNREEHIDNLLKFKSDLLVEIMRCKELDISLQKSFTDKWIEENL